MPVTPLRSVGDAEALHAARALSSTVALLSRAVGRALAPWNMTWPQAMSLLLLRAQNGPTTATRLVEQLGLGRTAMTAVVDRLERRGWVARRPHPRDRRVALVELTKDGRSVADEVAAVVQATLDDLMSRARLTDELDTVSVQIITALKSEATAP